MKKNKPSEKKINRKITEREFLIGLKNYPWSLDIWFAIDRLKNDCLGTQHQSKRAKSLLKKAGLTCFIPKGSTYHKTNNPNWRFWQLNSYIAIQIIYRYESAMKPVWDETDNKDAKREKAAACLYGKTLNKEHLKKLRAGERDAHITNFALSCFSDIEEIPFPSLKKFFFNDPEWKQERAEFLDSLKPESEQTMRWKGIKISELLPLIELPSDPRPTVSALQQLISEKGIYCAEELFFRFFWFIWALRDEPGREIKLRECWKYPVRPIGTKEE